MNTFAERLAALLPDAPETPGEKVASAPAPKPLAVVTKPDPADQVFLPYGLEALTGKRPGFGDLDIH